MPEEYQDIRNQEDDNLDNDGDQKGGNPIYFPPSSCSDDERIIIQGVDQADNGDTPHDFSRACRLAVESNRPLHLTTSFLQMKETIVLRRQETLFIVGHRECGSETENNESTILQGDLHSLFVLNNFSQLTLRHVSLKHTLEPSADNGEAGDHRQVGAAVNLRKKSRLHMTNGNLHSTCGFCLWIVQKCFVTLQNCQLTATLRSPLVCFGQPTVHLSKCQIVDAGVHALCARGECQVRLEDCLVTGSASRAIYAYAQASLTLVRTTVTGTIRHDKAAIEVSASSGGNNDDNSNKDNPNAPKKASKKGKSGHLKVPLKSTLIMNDCKVCDNQGIGILIRGDVEYTLSKTECTGNAMGNVVKTTALQGDHNNSDTQTDLKKTSAVLKTPMTTISPIAAATAGGSVRSPPTCIAGLKRDASGSSSFRQGDWWCPKCYQDWYKASSRTIIPTIVMAGITKCPVCGLEAQDCDLSKGGTNLGLTVSEIASLNRGRSIDIRKELLSLKTTMEQSMNDEANNNKRCRRHQWMFDGDDKGWLPYDTESNKLLEEAFHRIRQRTDENDEAASPSPPNGQGREMNPGDDNDDETKRNDDGLLVTLCQGRYQVDLEKMQQVNIESQMLRFVKRVEVPGVESKV